MGKDAQARFAEDKRDMEAIEQWHTSTVATCILDWQSRAMQFDRVCPAEAEVLFCDEKQSNEQEVKRILDTKESLVQAWYEQKHGFSDVYFRSNQRGTMRYMRFVFLSCEVESKLRFESLKGQRNYEADTRAAL